MCCAMGYFILTLLIYVLCASKVEPALPPLLHCINNTCVHSVDPCIITNNQNHLYGHCVHFHDKISVNECANTLRNHESCVCYTQECISHVEPVHSGYLCGNRSCHHDEGCYYIFNDGAFQSHCKNLNELKQIQGCQNNLPCYCTDAGCNQHVNSLQVHGHLCGNRTCHSNEACLHTLEHDVLHSQCKSLQELQNSHMPHGMIGHLPRYCLYSECNKDVYSNFSGQKQVHPHSSFQCGNRNCSFLQVCVIAKVDNQHLNYTCLDNKTANARQCLPNLPTSYSTCFCETRTCVDLTVVAIMQGLHLTGIICNDTDLTVCPEHQVCVIRHRLDGIWTRQCGPGRSTHECTKPPATGEICHCSSQQCVYGTFSVVHKSTTPTALHHTTTRQQTELTMPLLSSTKKEGLQHTTLQTTTEIQYTTPPSTIVSQTSSSKCHTCGDINNLIPCYNKEVFDNNNSSSIVCAARHDFCMTDIYQDSHGNIDIYKRCVTDDECNKKWIGESAEFDYCSRYGTVENQSAYECHFCCQGDHCNTEIQPPVTKLVAKAFGK